MQPEDRDAAYLWDMLDAARTAIEFIKQVDFEQYAADRKLQFAVERAVEIIGEAAGKVSESFRDAHPEVPWRSIIAQRNVLAHQYGEILPRRIWLLVTSDIPDLIERLEPLVPPPPPQARK